MPSPVARPSTGQSHIFPSGSACTATASNSSANAAKKCPILINTTVIASGRTTPVNSGEHRHSRIILVVQYKYSYKTRFSKLHIYIFYIANELPRQRHPEFDVRKRQTAGCNRLHAPRSGHTIKASRLVATTGRDAYRAASAIYRLLGGTGADKITDIASHAIHQTVDRLDWRPCVVRRGQQAAGVFQRI